MHGPKLNAVDFHLKSSPQENVTCNLQLHRHFKETSIEIRYLSNSVQTSASSSSTVNIFASLKMISTGTASFRASIVAPISVRTPALLRKQGAATAPLGLGFR